MGKPTQTQGAIKQKDPKTNKKQGANRKRGIDLRFRCHGIAEQLRFEEESMNRILPLSSVTEDWNNAIAAYNQNERERGKKPRDLAAELGVAVIDGKLKTIDKKSFDKIKDELTKVTVVAQNSGKIVLKQKEQIVAATKINTVLHAINKDTRKAADQKQEQLIEQNQIMERIKREMMQLQEENQRLKQKQDEDKRIISSLAAKVQTQNNEIKQLKAEKAELKKQDEKQKHINEQDRIIKDLQEGVEKLEQEKIEIWRKKTEENQTDKEKQESEIKQLKKELMEKEKILKILNEPYIPENVKINMSWL